MADSGDLGTLIEWTLSVADRSTGFKMPRVPKIKTTRQIAADLDTIVPKDTELSVRNVFGCVP